MKQFVITFLTISFALLVTGSSFAFVCANEAIICNGPTLSGTIGLSPQEVFNPCGDSSSFKHKLYSFNLATAQEITVTVTGTPAASMQIIVFENCDENSCLARTAVGAGTLDLCLPAGDYTIGLSYLIANIISYDVSVTCSDCAPVSVEATTFGVIKSHYR